MVALELQTAGRLSSISSTVTVHRFTARTAAPRRLSHNPCLPPHGCGGPRTCRAAGPAQTGTPLFYHHTGLHDSLHLHWPVRLRLRSFLMSIKASQKGGVTSELPEGRTLLRSPRHPSPVAQTLAAPPFSASSLGFSILWRFAALPGSAFLAVVRLLSGYCQAVADTCSFEDG